MELSHIPDAPGVYMMRNTRTGERYIGQSMRMAMRVHDHLQYLRCGYDECHGLQRSYNAHGEQAFEVLVLECLLHLQLPPANQSQISWHRIDAKQARAQERKERHHQMMAAQQTLRARERHYIASLKPELNIKLSKGWAVQ